MAIEESLYRSSSHYATDKPVTCTMIFAALAGVFIKTDAKRKAIQEAMATAFQVGSDQRLTRSGGDQIPPKKNNLHCCGCTDALILQS
mmetsp:Transcript_8460/g.11139  ORF Transcript_8460/g.11139 Transcript_8460/m.11139 type:complete len:88 (+) Transcript_8460:277-540(+)